MNAIETSSASSTTHRLPGLCIEGDVDSNDATFRQRFSSFWLDVVLFSFFYPLVAMAAVRLEVENPDERAYVIALVVYCVGFVAVGVTPASWLLNIRIADSQDRAPGLWRALRRSLIPGTVWVLVADDARAFNGRIASLYETHPIIEGALFWMGGLALMLYFWIYLARSGEGRRVRTWHDAIAGTRVVAYRGHRKASLDYRLQELWAWLLQLRS